MDRRASREPAAHPTDGTAGPRSPIQVFRFGAEGLEESQPRSLRGVRSLAKPGHVLWVDVNAVEESENLATLQEEFGAHSLTIEDLRSTHQRPKVETYPGYLFVVTQMIKKRPDGALETEQVGILLGDDWVLTIQQGKPGDVFDKVRRELRGGNPAAMNGGGDHLLYLILDALVDAAFPILEQFGRRAEALEDVILEEHATDVRERIQDLRRDLLTVRRIAWPQRDMLLSLSRDDHRYIRPGTRTFLRDVADESTRVIDFVETNREVVASLMDLHLADVAHRTNAVVRILTVVSTIFIPLTFLVGVWGMNFRHMPELEAPWGYPFALVVMGALGLGLFVAFRRRGWV